MKRLRIRPPTDTADLTTFSSKAFILTEQGHVTARSLIIVALAFARSCARRDEWSMLGVVTSIRSRRTAYIIAVLFLSAALVGNVLYLTPSNHHVTSLPPTYRRCPPTTSTSEWTETMAPCITLDLSAQSASVTTPIYSIIITVWNQEAIIQTVIENAIRHARRPFEVVIAFDGARDQTIPIVHQTLWRMAAQCNFDGSNDDSRLIQVPAFQANTTLRMKSDDNGASCINADWLHVVVVYKASAVFETAINNIALRASSSQSEYLILIQDDIIVYHPAYTDWLALPARLWPDETVGVSGRCAHRRYTANPLDENDGQWTPRCFTDLSVPMSAARPSDHCTFFIRDTANRGPLMLVANRARQLGFFDEDNYYLDDSDHDLFARAYDQYRWITGALHVNFTMDFKFGGSRAKAQDKPPATAMESAHRERMKSQYEAHKGRLWEIDHRRPFFSHSEDRRLPGQLYEYCLHNVIQQTSAEWFTNKSLIAHLTPLTLT